jgi:hypothetical protein
MSSFDGSDLFGSGPHRFHIGPRGDELRAMMIVNGDPSQAGLQTVGPLDADILVRGRLIADSDAALQALLSTISTKLADPPVTSDLEDNHATTYSGFSFISFTPADRIDRGAKVSLAYTARFTKFGGW